MNKKVALKNLITLSKLFDKYKIKYWLTDGTLLGLHREGDFISHDKDTDIGIDFESFNKSVISDLKKEFGNIRVLGHVEDSLELMVSRGGVRTDLFFFYKNNNKYYHSAFSEFNGNKYRRIDYLYDKFDTKKVNFLGYEFSVPEDPLKFILTKYGDKWEIPNKSWRYDYSPKNHLKTNKFIDSKVSNEKFKKWLEGL